MKKYKFIISTAVFILFSIIAIKFVAQNWYAPLNFSDDWNIIGNVELHPLNSGISDSSSQFYDWVYVLGSSDYDEYAHVVIENYLDSFAIKTDKPHQLIFLYYNAGMPLSALNNDQYWLGLSNYHKKYMLKISYSPDVGTVDVKKYKDGKVVVEIGDFYSNVMKIGLGNFVRSMDSLSKLNKAVYAK